MKKELCLCLVLVLLLGLTACGKKKEAAAPNTEQEVTEVIALPPEPVAEP